MPPPSGTVRTASNTRVRHDAQAAWGLAQMPVYGTSSTWLCAIVVSRDPSTVMPIELR
jgi:hypothetical protein